MSKKVVSIFELTLIVLSSFAFAYFVSTDLPDVFEKQNSVIQFLTRPMLPVVSASPAVPSGCCKETVSGATCQDMVLADKDLCKTDLVGAGCSFVSECKKGCCYDADSGMCSLNAPQETCIENGGEWDASTTCNIPQCQVGCCILGDGAAMMTTRECTQISNEYKIEKEFKPLDSKGTCDVYSDPTDMGACLFKSDDYSGEMNCIFTTKSKCVNSGREFKKDYLCTSKELNTTCVKTTKTSCFDGDDRVYFVDSCGNKANVYDSKKAEENDYWEKIILPQDSCIGSPETCGNCNYATGSICTKYATRRDLVKPEIGEYVCKNLNCINGRKHGESWCMSDTKNISVIGYPVGTRNYVASCFEGEIRIEGCADFNQEICLENKDVSTGYTEAKCLINDWRSCIYANTFDSYTLIKRKCDTLPQCIMFNEIPGNEKYKDLPGFKENITNDDQGRAGGVGKGMNKYVMQCMPRFTPGYQFWTTSASSYNGNAVTSSARYGGSEQETDAICSLADFSCVSHIETTTPMINPTPHDRQNPECNLQAVSQSNQKVSLMMEALNEKCRMMGSCGMQYNSQGELGSEGFSVSRIYVDKKGKNRPFSSEGYDIPEEYLNDSLRNSQKSWEFGEIETLSEISKGEGASYVLEMVEGRTTDIIGSSGEGLNQTAREARSAINNAGGNTEGGDINWAAYTLGGITAAGISAITIELTFAMGEYVIGSSTGNLLQYAAGSIGSGTYGQALAGTESTVTSVGFDFTSFTNGLGVAVFSIVGSLLGSYIGGMIAESAGMTPGQSTAFIGMIAAVGSAIGIGIAALAGFCTNPISCIIGLVIAIIMFIYSMFTGEDHEYYITKFDCNAWQPPAVGKCDECNNDVRPCSEFKCRSLGANCKYFVDNGEPGYCATLVDIWSAKIKPWNEKLTSGNKYTNISDLGFRITSSESGSKEVAAWKTVKFGIITDDQAICKLDTNYSKKYEEMRFTFATEKNYETGKVDGLYHWIALTPHVLSGDNEIEEGLTMPPLNEGENNYYVICQNFAGVTNDLPFVVQVKQAEGPDLTPAEIVRLDPADKSYLAKDTTNATIWVYLDEPAECKYSLDYDYNYYEEMPNNFSCLTGKDQGFYGEWPCMAVIPNISKTLKMYIKCKDNPELIETETIKRNQNKISYQYEFYICPMGLEINSIQPTGKVEVNSSKQVNLEVRTSGCINDGEAECMYRMPYYGNAYSAFWSTGTRVHTQPLTDLGSGERTVEIECLDKAGNQANASVNFTVFFDDYAPGIIRAYEEGGKIVLETTEEANCAININETKACDFKITPSNNYVKKHSVSLTENAKKQTLYIRCEDKKGNAPVGCTEIIKMIDLQRGK